MRSPRLLHALTLTTTLLALASAHGSHNDQAPLPSDADWATRHMQEEHHISNFDGSSFFKLHDFDSDGAWEPSEIQRTYGLEDESLRDVGAERRDEVVKGVLRIFDEDGDERVSLGEWMRGLERGERLPDFGLGPSHHGDDEWEYEIHHYEKYHDENTREEDLIHPEDIAHFRKHQQDEDAAERQAAQDRMEIVEKNIPMKFRRRS